MKNKLTPLILVPLLVACVGYGMSDDEIAAALENGVSAQELIEANGEGIREKVAQVARQLGFPTPVTRSNQSIRPRPTAKRRPPIATNWAPRGAQPQGTRQQGTSSHSNPPGAAPGPKPSTARLAVPPCSAVKKVPQYTIPQADSTSVIGLVYTPLKSVPQGGSECPTYALCNAWAISQMFEQGVAVTNTAEQNRLCREARQRCGATGMGLQNLNGQDLMPLAHAAFGPGVLDETHNVSIINMVAGEAQAGDLLADPLAGRQAIQLFATGALDVAHFLVNTGGHWILFSLVRQNDLLHLVYMNSTNAPVISPRAVVARKHIEALLEGMIAEDMGTQKQ